MEIARWLRRLTNHALPHEKAERGKGTYGRQAEDFKAAAPLVGVVVVSKPVPQMSIRVYRAATDTWEDRGRIA